MSWTTVRPYFNAVLESLGYTEWAEAFAVDELPDTVMDRSYHVQPTAVEGIKQNQLDQETIVGITLRTYFKGYRNSQEAVDTALAEAERIMIQLVKVSDVGGRVSTSGIVNVVFNDVALDPVDASNDNAVIATASYSVRVVVAVNE